MWRTVKLGDACEILDSLRKPITKKFRNEGNVPYYGATGIVDWVTDYIFDEKLVLAGEDGAKWGSGDKTAFIVEGKTWVNNHAHVLRPRAELVTHEWIAYYLTSIDLSPWVTGLTVPKLNQAQLRSIPIPLPPLAEQQRIVAKLEAVFAEIDKAIEIAEAKEAEVDRLKASVLTKFLSNGNWRNAKLEELCTIRTGKKDVNEGNPIGKFPFFTCAKEHTYSDTFSFDCEAILIAGNGAVGQTAYYKGKFEAYQRTYVLCEFCDILPKLLLFVLQGRLMQHLSSMVLGNTIPYIKKGMLQEFAIPLPPACEQTELVSKLEGAFADVEIAGNTVRALRENLIALKNAILTHELQPSETS